MNNHAIFNGTHCAFWDVDSLNLVGIADADIDNGLFVTLGALNADDTYTVAVGANADYICGTPAVGFDVETASMDDVRYFYNKAGRPISVKRLLVGDVIELSAASFTATPQSTDTYAEVQASGKLTSSTTNTQSYKIEGTRTMDIGGDAVTTYLLRKMK